MGAWEHPRMEFRAAAEASATSGWFEGWIGGLIAAAVTLAFTAWWETRQHRRRQLDDAITKLADAQTEFTESMIRMAAKGWDSSEAARTSGRVETWHTRVDALAGRRVLGMPARIVAPSRAGLRVTLVAVAFTWRTHMVIVATNPPRKPDHLEEYHASLAFIEPLIDASDARVAVCNAWLHNPWRFAPGRDLSGWAQSKDERRKPLN